MVINGLAPNGGGGQLPTNTENWKFSWKKYSIWQNLAVIRAKFSFLTCKPKKFTYFYSKFSAMGWSSVGTWPPPSGQPTWIGWWEDEKKLESNFCWKHSKMSSRRTIIPSLVIIWRNEEKLQHKMRFHYFSYTSRHQRTREKTGENRSYTLISKTFLTWDRDLKLCTQSQEELANSQKLFWVMGMHGHDLGKVG